MSKFIANLTIREILQSEADSQVLYLLDDLDTSYVTQNCGKTLNSLEAQEKYKKQLYVSNDFGSNWKLVLNRTKDGIWDKLIELPEVMIWKQLNKEVQLQWNQYYLLKIINNIHLLYWILLMDLFLYQSHIWKTCLNDMTGTKYTLSLLNNLRSLDTGNSDFENIMKGIYIANIYDNTEFVKFKLRRSTKNTDGIKRLENYKQSRITFEQGGEWHAIKTPKYDYMGQPIQCNGDWEEVKHVYI